MLRKNWHMLEWIILLVLLILYSVGIWGFANSDESIINLTPVHLMISLLMLLMTKNTSNVRWFVFLILVYIIGFGIEAIGVNTGWPFGSYQYGDVFGTHLFDTPLLIGVNWVMLVLGSASAVEFLLPKVPKWLKITIQAFLMVLLDFLIEPVAIQFNFWTWNSTAIPFSNYAAWFVISLVMHILREQIIGTYQSKIATGIFVLQFIFFGLIQLLT
jgi:putative membrane protein